MFKRVLAVMVMGTVAVGGGCADAEDDGLGDFRNAGGENPKSQATAGSNQIQVKTICEDPRGELGWPWWEDPAEWNPGACYEAFEADALGPATDDALEQFLGGQPIDGFCQQLCLEDLGMQYVNEYEALPENVLVHGGPQLTGWQQGNLVELSFDLSFDLTLYCSCG